MSKSGWKPASGQSIFRFCLFLFNTSGSFEQDISALFCSALVNIIFFLFPIFSTLLFLFVFSHPKNTIWCALHCLGVSSYWKIRLFYVVWQHILTLSLHYISHSEYNQSTNGPRKLKSFCIAKKPFNHMKRQPREWEKVFTIYKPDRKLVFGIHK